MEIFNAKRDELGGIMDIERASFSVPWSINNMLYEIDCEDSSVGVAKEDGATVGFVILHRIGDESEIFNIAVREDHRGGKIGRRLMEWAINEAKLNNVSKIYLEVRESNTVAYSLYQSLGFETLSVRKNYYDAPKENGIIMALDLKRGNNNVDNVG